MAVYKYQTKADADDGWQLHEHEIPASTKDEAMTWLEKEYGIRNAAGEVVNPDFVQIEIL